MKRILGFDFGLKHIGVAVGESISGTAQLLDSLKAKKGNPDWAQIDALITLWAPGQLLVGLPLNMDGTRQPMTDRAQTFLNQLAEQTGLPCAGVDERLTTVEAKDQLFAEYGFKGLQKSLIDSLSAKLMIEQWLRGQ